MSSPEPTRVPAHLAQKILGSRSELEGERRTVTVLFADAVGSTALAERLDEEDVYLILQGAVELMVEAVHRYEGTVTHFLGDGIMALFGAPIAYEDAARRAVAAALDMQGALGAYLDEMAERQGSEMRFRVGLNTGRVVVGRISDQLGMEYTAIGDTTNLAARMQQLAEPGSVYMSESTHQAARDYFEFEDLGELVVKGKAAPVRTYKVLRERAVRTRFEAASEHGFTPFVGRERELGLLHSYLEEAGRGEGQVVFVSGEAGIGKSRLLLEFRRSLDPGEVSWREGHCVSFGRIIPYLPIIELVKGSFGVEDADDEGRVIERVMMRNAKWDEAARVTVPYLRYLLNVDPGDPAVERMDPRERRAGLFEGLRALVVMESRTRLLVAVIEDLHWMDEQSAEMLAALVDVVASLPVLLVLTHRPGYTPSLPDRSYFSRLALRRLPDRESVAVAEAVLETEELPLELKHLVISKGEGNPFYVEEVTRCLVEAGAVLTSDRELVVQRSIEDLRLPDTIQEIILSRIDLLDHDARHAIQQAAVIGREFTARLLKRVSDLEAQLEEALAELKSLELVYEKQFFPELSYTFKHALTHDVAYATLLRERRRQLHRLVGAAIEELYADRLGEYFETLAHHYYEGQQWDKALDYLVKAGDKASAAYANLQAGEFYSKALEVCEQLGKAALPTMVSVAEKRARLGLMVGDVPAAVADFDLSRDAAERLGDRRVAGRALAWRGLIEPYGYDFERAEATLRAALALGEQEGFDDVRLLASMGLGKLLQATRHEEADRYLRLAGKLAVRVPDPAGRAWWSVFGGFRPNWTGRFDEAIAHAERWRGAGEAAGNATMELGQRWVEALARAGRGEYDEALELVEGVVSEAERIGEFFVRSRALNTIGWLYGELQDHERALEWNRQGVEAAVGMNARDFEVEGNARLNLGDTLAALGRLEEAEQQYVAVERVVRDPRPPQRFMLWRFSQHLFHSCGQLWLARGQAERALAYADECLRGAQASDSRKYVVKGRRLRGEALLAAGRLEAAESELSAALGVSEELGNPPQLWKTHAAFGKLLEAQGKTDPARREYQEALAVVEGVSQRLRDERLRQSLMSSAEVKALQTGGAGPPSKIELVGDSLRHEGPQGLGVHHRAAEPAAEYAARQVDTEWTRPEAES